MLLGPLERAQCKIPHLSQRRSQTSCWLEALLKRRLLGQKTWTIISGLPICAISKIQRILHSKCYPELPHHLESVRALFAKPKELGRAIEPLLLVVPIDYFLGVELAVQIPLTQSTRSTVEAVRQPKLSYPSYSTRHGLVRMHPPVAV